jgi:hypothetical protein
MKGNIQLYDRHGNLERKWTKEQIDNDPENTMEEILFALDYVLNGKDVTEIIWGDFNEELGENCGGLK